MLNTFERKYQDSYPTIAQLWQRHWQNIIPIFATQLTSEKLFTRLMSLKQPQKIGQAAFPTEDALFKILYLAIDKASQKWTMPIRAWKKALNWFAQIFGDRLLDSYTHIEQNLS